MPSSKSVEVMVGTEGSSSDPTGLTVPTSTVSPFRSDPEDERTLVMSQLYVRSFVKPSMTIGEAAAVPGKTNCRWRIDQLFNVPPSLKASEIRKVHSPAKLSPASAEKAVTGTNESGNVPTTLSAESKLSVCLSVRIVPAGLST